MEKKIIIENKTYNSKITKPEYKTVLNGNVSISGLKDHNLLNNLNWLDSLHTGTADKLAGFDSEGNATFYDLPDYTTVDWGEIQGTLSDQTDLQDALNLKTDLTVFNSHTGDSSIHYPMDSISITESQISDLDKYTTSQVNNLLSFKADTSSISAVGFSGEYSDILNTPTIPTVPVDSVFGRTGVITAQTGDYDYSQITNTPTNVSQFINDSGYITDISGFTTDNLTDTATNRYTNDTDITRLANTSGTNTGDQDLTGFVPYVGATADVNITGNDFTADSGTFNGLLTTEKASGTPTTTNSLLNLRDTISNIGCQMGASSSGGWIRAVNVGVSVNADLTLQPNGTKTITGGDLDVGGNIQLNDDNQKLYMGAGNDAYLSYNGNRQIYNSNSHQFVGSVGVGGIADDNIALDVHGRIRVVQTSSSAPIAGKGFEIFSSANNNYGFLFSIDRDNGDQMLPIRFEGKPLEFWVGNDLSDDFAAMVINTDDFVINMDADETRLLNTPTGAVANAIATTGYVDDKHTRVGFSARNSNQSCPAASFTTVNFITEEEDTNDAWNGNTFTCPTGEDGWYLIAGHATFTSITDGNRAIVGVEKNGSLTLGGLLGRGANGSTTLGGFGGALRLYLTAGDTIRMAAYCENTTTLYNSNQTGYTTFSAYKEK